MLSSDKNPEQSSGNGIVDVDALIKRFSDDASGEGTKNVFAEGVLANLGEDVDGECCICFDVMEVPMVVPDCMHQWYV